MGKEVEGVANGLSKTMCLAKFSSNFTGLSQSCFSVVICTSQSLFFARPGKSQITGVFFLFFIYINQNL